MERKERKKGNYISQSDTNDPFYVLQNGGNWKEIRRKYIDALLQI